MTDEKIEVNANDVRSWAREKGYEVGTRGHLPVDVIDRYNRQHRKRQYTNKNPWLGDNR